MVRCRMSKSLSLSCRQPRGLRPWVVRRGAERDRSERRERERGIGGERGRAEGGARLGGLSLSARRRRQGDAAARGSTAKAWGPCMAGGEREGVRDEREGERGGVGGACVLIEMEFVRVLGFLGILLGIGF